MTLRPSQNLRPQVFLRVPYYQLHYSPFIWHAAPTTHSPRLICGWYRPSTSVLATRYYIPQTQYCNNDLTQILHYVETSIIEQENWSPIIFQIFPDPNQFQDTFGPWTSTVRYLVLVLDSKLLFNRHLHTVASKAIGVPCDIFPFLGRDSALTQTNKLTLYKSLIRSNLT